MIRVLYIPFASSPKSLSSDHTFGWSGTFFSYWLSKCPDLILYMVIPKGAFEEQRNAFYKFEPYLDRIKFIEHDSSDIQVVELSRVPDVCVDKFSVRNNSLYFDMLFCEKPAILGEFLLKCEFYRTEMSFKTVVLNIHYMIDENAIPLVNSYFVSNIANCGMADAFLFGCGDNADVDSYKMLSSLTKRELSSQKVLDLSRKTRFVKCPIDVAELDSVLDRFPVKESKEFRVHWGSSVNILFDFPGIYPVIKNFLSRHGDSKFVITNPGGLIKWVDDNTRLEKHLSCPRRKFYEIARQSHVCVFKFSKGHEVLHGGVLEMSYLGIVPIFWKGSIPYPWPKDYKLQYGTDDELYALLNYVKKNLHKPEIVQLIASNQELIRKSFLGLNDKIISTITQIHLNKLQAKSLDDYPFGKLLKDNLPSDFSLSDAIALIKEKSDVKIDLTTVDYGKRLRMQSVDYLRSYLKANSFVEYGTVDEVRFRRNP